MTAMAGTRPMTQDERRASARKAIIDAAVRVLADEGYRRTTFTRIQDVSGVSRGLITYHFGTKARLIEAVITSLRDTYAEQAIAPRAVDTLCGRDAVLAMVDSYVERLAKDPTPASVMLVIALSSDAEEPEVVEAVRRRFAEMRADLVRWLERGRQDGSIDENIDPAAAAVVIEGALRGIALQFAVDPASFEVLAARHQMTSLVSRGLAPHT